MALNEWVLLSLLATLALAGYALSLATDRTRDDKHLDNVRRPHRRRTQALSILYVASIMGVNLGTNLEWYSSRTVALASIVTSAAIGVAAVVAYLMWLRAEDDLIRKIETDALALSFGLGFVGIMATAQLSGASVGPTPNVNRILLVMLLTYAISRAFGYRRFR